MSRCTLSKEQRLEILSHQMNRLNKRYIFERSGLSLSEIEDVKFFVSEDGLHLIRGTPVEVQIGFWPYDKQGSNSSGLPMVSDLTQWASNCIRLAAGQQPLDLDIKSHLR